MLEGLKLAWEMEFDDVICLSDSFNGINLVKDGEGSCYSKKKAPTMGIGLFNLVGELTFGDASVSPS
ncbi:hypothetical protein glysoja_043049 [Glycine soja]|uniref:RNase H type-1 domain-containing protein n=1 Tax=Glycine soja TaxID=3848 RepID=A0A0B2R929_GLYSO|nr:hypothetical protein glysoja_043049 [Glycine soja]